MTCVYKSEEGQRQVEERYRRFLEHWPAPSQQLRVPTREGETLVVACGDAAAPPLLLLHGSGGNAAMWMGDVAAWAAHFRVYAIDMIGEPGLSAPSRPPPESDAYALWLDDVMAALALERVSIVGMSLGGWLALDYATRRTERVRSLVLLCPGGVGRQKTGGEREMVMRAPAGAPAPVQRFFEFIALIQEHFCPRIVELPVFSDDALGRLSMPLMAILGGKDVLLDSGETRRRLERHVPHAVIRYLPEGGHLLPRQTSPILDFLNGGSI